MVPTQAEVGGDFSALLQSSTPALATDMNGNPTSQIALDCNNNPTYVGEIFNSRLAGSSNLEQSQRILPRADRRLSGVPAGFQPTSFPTAASILWGRAWQRCFPSPTAPREAVTSFLPIPSAARQENKFDIRGDYTISSKDNFFARFSYGNDRTFLPSPFNNVLDGGAFQDGYSDNIAEGLAASEIHTFRNNLINEFRFGFNHLEFPPLQSELQRQRGTAAGLSRSSVPDRTSAACLRSASVMAPRRLAAPDSCPRSRSSTATFLPTI